MRVLPSHLIHKGTWPITGSESAKPLTENIDDSKGQKQEHADDGYDDVKQLGEAE